MVAASITFTQSAVSPGAGISMVGVGGALVTLTNADDTGVISWLWELLDTPLNSALVPVTLGTAASASFTPDTPDTPGCYRIKLTVQGADGSVACDVKNFAVPTTQGWILPPFRASAAELNFPGNTEGWESLLNTIFLGISSDVASYAVANIAGLSALVTAGLDDGAVIQVNTLKAPWRLDKTDTTTPVDGITVVASDTGARWFRQDTVDLSWNSKPAFFINASTGDDEADGLTSGTALKTWAEFARRTNVDRSGLFSSNMDVTIETDIPITDPIWVKCTVLPQARVKVHGSLTILGGPFAVTSYTRDSAANDPSTLTAAWDPSLFINKMIRFTSGVAAGAYAWVAKNLGAGAATITRPVIVETDTFKTPAPGDLFEVVEGPSVYPFQVSVTCSVSSSLFFAAPGVVLSDLRLLSDSFQQYVRLDTSGSGLERCDVQGYLYCIGCLNLKLLVCRITYAVFDQSRVQSTRSCLFTASNGVTYVACDFAFLSSGTVCVNTRVETRQASLYIGEAYFVDCSNPAIRLLNSRLLADLRLMGAGNSGKILKLDASSQAFFSVVPVAQSSDPAPYQIDNDSFAFTDLPRTDVDSGSAIQISGTASKQTYEVKLASLAELAAFRTLGTKNGTKAWVQTPLCDYVLDQDSALLPDGVDVIAAVDGGRWIRQIGAGAGIINAGIKGPVTAGTTLYALADLTGSATDVMQHVVNHRSNARSLCARLATAPGGTETVEIALGKLSGGFVVYSATILTFTGTDKDKKDSSIYFSVVPGDLVSFKVTSSGASVAADLSISLEVG